MHKSKTTPDSCIAFDYFTVILIGSISLQHVHNSIDASIIIGIKIMIFVTQSYCTRSPEIIVSGRKKIASVLDSFEKMSVRSSMVMSFIDIKFICMITSLNEMAEYFFFLEDPLRTFLIVEFHGLITKAAGIARGSSRAR